MPIPPYIRQALTGYASEDSMNRVRYKIGDNGFFNLANVLERGGFASAVTLIDVVVFRGPNEAQDLTIWAHELTHVDQYAQWGVHSFAVQYTRDYGSVEAPAYAKGNGYGVWAQQQGMGMAWAQQQGMGARALPPNLPSVYPAPAYPAPVPQQWAQQPPNFYPARVPQQGYGAFCYTPFGRFGPGPLQPFGAPCNVNGVLGQIGM
jgi:hypothetical protein